LLITLYKLWWGRRSRQSTANIQVETLTGIKFIS
jgi:hypothetical protein